MGYGNNAAPVAEGKCCDNCNFTQVISARLVKEVVVKEEEEEDNVCPLCGILPTTCDCDRCGEVGCYECITMIDEDEYCHDCAEQEEEEEGSECVGCAKIYIVDTDIGDQFCNDCGDDWFCLECLDYGDGWDLEYTEFLCFRCDDNRQNEEEEEDEEEEVQEG